MSAKKGVIGILTGGGDVPGLNPAIRAVTIRALREGYRVIGIRRGWLGTISIMRDEQADNNENFQILTEEIVNRAGRTGGTFLHTSRTNPSAVKKEEVPKALRAAYNQDKNDLTSEVIKNLDWLGIEYLIPIGGDDTLSFATRLHKEGVKVIAIPKTMDNDVPGTDYCIGFSTCVSRTIELSNRLRTSAGSHERVLVMEVFEGGEMVLSDRTTDAFGHMKLGGIGDLVSAEHKDRGAKYNKGKPINVINQRLGYMVRGGDPDAIDSIVPMAYGNLALDLILRGSHGRLVVLKNGRYDNMPIEVVTSSKKTVNVEKYYNKERLRPLYTDFEMQPLFIMASE